LLVTEPEQVAHEQWLADDWQRTGWRSLNSWAELSGWTKTQFSFLNTRMRRC